MAKQLLTRTQVTAEALVRAALVAKISGDLGKHDQQRAAARQAADLARLLAGTECSPTVVAAVPLDLEDLLAEAYPQPVPDGELTGDPALEEALP